MPSADVEFGSDGDLEDLEAVAGPSSAPPPSAHTSAGLTAAVRDAAIELIEADPQSGAARAVLLEHCYQIGQDEVVANTLTGAETAGLERPRALVAALIAEMANDRPRMASAVERLSADAPGDEAALRMAMVLSDQAEVADRLIAYAGSCDDEASRAIALTEAGLRLMEEEGREAEGETMLRRAAEAQPALPIAGFIGMYISGALGDVDGEQFWLEHRRGAASEPGDAVADTLRSALHVGSRSVAEATSLLAEAHQARPNDYSLRDLYEQAAGAVDDRATWLVQRADQGGSDASAVALEAAVAFELDGDVEQAAACAQQAIDGGDEALAPIFAQRYALQGYGADRVIDKLEAQMRQATEPAQRAELAQIVAQIEARGRGDHAKAAGVLRDVLDHSADDLTLLHDLAAELFLDAEQPGLATVAMAIARTVKDADGLAHALLASRMQRQQRDGWEKTHEAAELVFGVDDPSVWALRNMSDHVRARGDHTIAATIDGRLADKAYNELDQATLTLRAAQAWIASGEEEAATSCIGVVLDALPRHLVALIERAGQLERLDEPHDAAQAYEELAMASQAPPQRAAALYKAATVWLSLEDGSGHEEGRRLLEAVSAIDANYKDTFERLQTIFFAAGAKRELADLLSARLASVEDPNERIDLEVMRGKMLVEAGSAVEAREALSAALEASPDHADALSAYADVCMAQGDWEAVEQSMVRLGRLVSEPDKQVEIYLRLGALYAHHLPNPERAQMAYQEVLKRASDNVMAREKLVDLFIESGDTGQAFEHQKTLIDAAKSQEETCQRTVRLAEIHEAAGEVNEAEQVLVKARRTWNKEPEPVLALYRYYKRNGQEPAADLLLDRAAADVRRGLGAGRFEAPLFAMARMVAEMREQADAALVAQSTLAAIQGEPAYIEGAGNRAGVAELDEHTAPEVFTEAFRSLLGGSGYLMDAAVPFDLKSLRAKPLSPRQADVLEQTRAIADGYGISEVTVRVTNALGVVCVPACSEPPTLCFGLPLVTAERADVREFLTHRALKVLQSRTAALSRTAPIDLWPLVAAFLKLHSPSFNPSGVDASKLDGFYQTMAPLAPKANPQLSLLASEVIGSIGNRASSLNTLANAWGSRTALLAMGDPNLALEAIAWAAGHSQGPPGSGPERVRWMGRQAEARDLIVFSVSDGYAAARSQLGLDVAVIDGDDLITQDN